MPGLSFEEIRRDLFPRGWARALGFEYATLVGLVWGLPLSTGRVRRDGDLIILTGLPRWAFKRGGVTVGRVYLTRDNDGPSVIEHEKVHVEQWRKYGMWMPVLYGLAGSNPFTNRFEIEAGLEKGGYRKPARAGGSASSATLSAESDASGPDAAPEDTDDTPPATRGEGARA
jgi:hypothetical protein